MSQEQPIKRSRGSGTMMFNETDPPSNWTYTVRTTPKSTTAYITDQAGEKIRIQLPRMRVPFGIQEPMNGSDSKEESKSRPNLELDVSDPDLVAWGNAVTDAAITYVAANSKELMKKTMRRDFVEQLFRATITPSRNNEYNPLLRTKVTKTGTYATNVVVVTDPGSPTTPLRHRQGELSDIERGDDIIPIVDVSCIWFANNSAGITLTLAHAMVFKKTQASENVFNIPGVAGVESDTTVPLDGDKTVASVAPTTLAPTAPGTVTVNFDSNLMDDPFA